MIEIRLFGPPEIRRGDVIAELDTRKALAVLARLAMASGPMSRDTLAALLWPEADETRARAVLRRTLSSLRQAIGADVLVTDRQTVRLDVDRVWIDTLQFDTLLVRTDDHGHIATGGCDHCLAGLDDAAALYRADFLDGFSVRDAPDFEAWVATTASHYRRQAALALERLATGRAECGDYSAAIVAGRRWLSLDTLHEPAHRMVMLLNAWGGDRSGAVEAYRECVRLLDQELGVSPLVETTDLYEAILAEDLPPAPSVPRQIEARAAPATAPPPPMLVGRDREWRLLGAHLGAAATAGRAVTVTGEPGVGKTRLIEEFAVRGPGAVTLVARAYRGEQTIPYGVAAQLVEAALTSPAIDAIRELPDWVLAVTSRLVPAVAGLRPGLPPEDDRAAHGSERRFVDGLEHVIAACGRPDGAAGLVVDDAQWLDSASSAFLAYLLRRISGHHLLMILSFRANELAADSPLGLAVADADGVDQLTQIELNPLQLDDVARLVRETGSTMDADEVWRRTGGLPLFVIEHLESPAPEVVPDRVRRALTARLHGLSELARQVLTAAAVLDGLIDPAVLRHVAGRSEDEEVEALDELLGKRLLREIRGGAQVEFVHPPMRDAVYAEATLVRRRLLHRRAAEALSATHKPDARDAAVVARHLQLAGDDAAAALASAHAGDLAREVFAQAEAAELYRAAIALGHPEPGVLHRSLGDVAMAVGTYGDALAAYQAAVARAGDADAALAEHRLGEVHRRLGHWEVAEEHFIRAEEHHPNPAELYADWSLLERRRGHHGQAYRRAERARSAAERADDRHGLARALDILGILTADPAEAIDYLERSLDLAGEDPALRTAALNNLSLVVESSGDLSRAVELAHEALGLAERMGDRHRQAALHNRMADLYHAAGDDESSRRALAEAVRLFAEVGSEAGTWEPEVWLLTQW